MIKEVVEAFVDAKIARADITVALFKGIRDVSERTQVVWRHHPYRREVQLGDPPKYLGTITLSAPDILLPETERRKLLRLKFLQVLQDAGNAL